MDLSLSLRWKCLAKSLKLPSIKRACKRISPTPRTQQSLRTDRVQAPQRGPAKRPPGGGSSPAVSGKAPKAKALSDGVAVAFKNRVMVIYVNYAGELSYLESPYPDEQSAKSPKEYTKKPVLLSSAKNPAADRITCRSQTGTSQTKLPRVASVAWGEDADERWRIYYIMENGKLDEIVWDSWVGDPKKREPKFIRGVLSESNITIIDNSVLTAAVDSQGIKLFYQQQTDGNTISWTSSKLAGDGKWSSSRLAATLF